MMERRWGRRRLLVLAGGGLLSACTWPGAAPAAPPLTIRVTRADVETTISASGAIAARADRQLGFAQSGPLAALLVEVGQRVVAGQPLARQEDRAARLAIAEAEAALAAAQAKEATLRAGATPKQLADAEAALREAEAAYERALRATPGAAEVAEATTALRAAEARLRQTQTGTATPTHLAEAEAVLRAAEARLERTRTGSAGAEEMVEAEATLRAAQAALTALQAAVPEAVAAAQRKLADAQANQTKQASGLAQAKENARLAMESAAGDVRVAQARYGAAKLIYDEAVRTGKDPNIPPIKGQPSDQRRLTDARLRQYKADLEAAEQAMRQAENRLASQRLAYEDARQQEIVGLQEAARRTQEAAAALATAEAGPPAGELAAARAAVERAQAQRDRLARPPSPAEIADAEAATARARAALETLRQPPRPGDLADAQAAVERARANLAKLQPAAPEVEVVAARARVHQARTALEAVQAGPAASDLAQATAAVRQAEASLATARLRLEQTVLLAPFAGLVARARGQIGQPAPTEWVVVLVDDAALQVEVRVAESEVARTRPGQAARLTVEALPDRPLTGLVTTIGPIGTTEQGIVSYPATVMLEGPAAEGVRVGMTATVTITTERRTGVLALPARALRRDGPQPTVEVLHQGQRFRVPVRLGLVGDTLTEIVAGLQEGDEVVIELPASTGLGPGGPGQDTVVGVPVGSAPASPGGAVFVTKP